MKFDSKDLMKAMGLSVGDRFVVKDNDAFDGIWEVVHDTIYRDQILCKNNKCAYQLVQFVEEEITLLSKYTLTEDEKVIVRQRYIMGFPYLERKDECVVLVNNDQILMFIEKEMFSFIKIGEKVLLDELRKCL